MATATLGPAPAQADNLNRWVTVVNKTGYTIVRFYASHKGMRNWGVDHLGRQQLPSGYSFQLNFSNDRSGYCIYDFRAEFDDGDVLERFGVNVCEIGTYTYN
ncbi:hypothetical protein KJP29_03355 [Maritimibacter sp. DP1N21-5]|nr:hypothetical protein [Maritimibacter sp. DP1N21-5]